MKLKSGREVKLVDLTMAQRIECEDTALIKHYPDGSEETLNQLASVVKWCQHGLGVKSLEDLNGYSDPELLEIFVLVRKAATRGVNPTKSAS